MQVLPEKRDNIVLLQSNKRKSDSHLLGYVGWKIKFYMSITFSNAVLLKQLRCEAGIYFSIGLTIESLKCGPSQ